MELPFGVRSVEWEVVGLLPAPWINSPALSNISCTFKYVH